MRRHLRSWVRKLERNSEPAILVPLNDGSTSRFSQADYVAAYLNAYERAVGGANVPPRHPLLDALENSSDPRLRDHLADLLECEGQAEPARDLSIGPNR